MIISFSTRDNHQDDKRINKWYTEMAKSDRSRAIREIILRYIDDVQEEVAHQKKTVRPKEPLKMVEMPTEKAKAISLDEKLDNLLGGI